MGKRFVEGKGWVIDEDLPAAGKAAPSDGKVQVVNQKPLAGLTRKDLEKIAGQMNLVVIEEADLKKTVARIGDLERLLDHSNQKLTELAGERANVVSPPGKSAEGLSKEDLEKAVAEAGSLDALTDLMKEVTDKKLLKLADARAEELKKGDGK